MNQSILDDALSISSGARRENYGTPEDNHTTTADFWRTYLLGRFDVDLPLNGRDVCWMNILQKASRDTHFPKRDNLVDTAGYAANAQECSDSRIQAAPLPPSPTLQTDRPTPDQLP